MEFLLIVLSNICRGIPPAKPDTGPFHAKNNLYPNFLGPVLLRLLTPADSINRLLVKSSNLLVLSIIKIEIDWSMDTQCY